MPPQMLAMNLQKFSLPYIIKEKPPFCLGLLSPSTPVQTGYYTILRKNHPVLKYAYEFAEADKYIISAPMWNLSTPSILNAYMDYVSAIGITFKYTERGPVGLCNGKKAIHIVSRGGKFSKGPAAMLEMGDRYLKSIFAFFGITDFTSIVAEGLDVIGQDVESIIEDKIKEAQVIAKSF